MKAIIRPTEPSLGGNYRFVAPLGALAFLFLAPQVLAGNVMSLLTLDGEVRAIGDVPPPTLRRIVPAEGGNGVVMDDYAVLETGGSGSSVVFSTDAFQSDPKRIQLVGQELASVTRISLPGEVSGTRSGNKKMIAPQLGLVIRHQRGHAPGHNYAPTPTSGFQPQRLRINDLEGQRGFAVVSVGETGRVLSVRLLVQGKPARHPDLQQAIAAGVWSVFQDAQRHDHTIYFAYRVQTQEVAQVGMPIVTMPMCCSCDPDPWDGIEYQCP